MIPKYKKFMHAHPFSINDRGNAIGVYNRLNGTFTPVSWQGSIEATYEKAADECERLYAEHRKEQR
jgi:hypothetical protein